jgi:serine/threonine-protein kinase
MSPEAAMDGELDGRADLYGLGCIAYWLLSGSLVFPRKTAVAMAMAHVKEEPPSFESIGVKGVPDELEALIHECLAKDRSDRPADAMELHRRLGKLDIESWTEERAASWWNECEPSSFEAHGFAPSVELPETAPSRGHETVNLKKR